MTIGAFWENSACNQLPIHSIWIIESHCKFSTDHFLLFKIFFFWESRVHHCISKDRNCFVGSGRRNVDPKYRAIVPSIGVNMPPEFLYMSGNVSYFPHVSSLEQHMF